jgi:predicted deacylase
MATPLVVPSHSPVPPTLPAISPLSTATLLPETFIFGTSVEGRDLEAHRFGTGNKTIVLVGGVHTGFETNTVRLVNELRAYYAASPTDILPQIALVLVPVLNPDGLEKGRQIAGRFNANGVDLNRNWGCGWSPEAFFRATPVSPGSAPFSEPETVALGSLIQQLTPAAVLFYHAAARGVFPGNCGQIVSDGLAQIYSAASGYPYSREFSDYSVTGSAPAWVDSLGIPAVDIELASAEDSEFTRNLNAIRAVMAWLRDTD